MAFNLADVLKDVSNSDTGREQIEYISLGLIDEDPNNFYNPRLRIAGLLPTMWYKAPEIQDAEHQLRAAGFRVFHHIRRSDKVDRMTFQQEALLISSPNSGAGIDYRAFVAEYVGGI